MSHWRKNVSHWRKTLYFNWLQSIFFAISCILFQLFHRFFLNSRCKTRRFVLNFIDKTPFSSLFCTTLYPHFSSFPAIASIYIQYDDLSVSLSREKFDSSVSWIFDKLLTHVLCHIIYMCKYRLFAKKGRDRDDIWGDRDDIFSVAHKKSRFHRKNRKC